MTPPHIYDKLTRREVLGVMGLAGAAAAAAACGSSSKPGATSTATQTAGATAAATAGATGTAAPNAVSCVVRPQMTEGPYFVDEQLDRSDIRPDPTNGAVPEGAPVRLVMGFRRVDANGNCVPLDGAHIDVWHCDALGKYSDEAQNNTVGQKFLRGYQLTDADGNVEFMTIYPGWYMGRTVHIHIKARTEPTSQRGYEFTSQLFFDDAFTDQIFQQAPYSTRGRRDTRNAQDSIYSGGGAQMILKTGPEGDHFFAAIGPIGMQMA